MCSLVKKDLKTITKLAENHYSYNAKQNKKPQTKKQTKQEVSFKEEEGVG